MDVHFLKKVLPDGPLGPRDSRRGCSDTDAAAGEPLFLRRTGTRH
jgi:hypothetical protein